MQRDTTIEATLRSIENRVMGEVWLGPARRRAGRVFAAALGVAAVISVIEAHQRSHGIALTAGVLFLSGAFISLAALRVQRFGWACAAVYVCGVATVAGVGAFWWYRTGQVDSMPLITLFGSIVSAVLTVGWLTVLMTPIQRSQPDMRS